MTSTDWFEGYEERSDRIDTMLTFMVCQSGCEVVETGRVPQYSVAEIADFCGCDRKVIAKAEMEGLEKLKSQMREYNVHSPG